jgi:6-phospho-3-hexuloisomerase
LFSQFKEEPGRLGRNAEDDALERTLSALAAQAMAELGTVLSSLPDEAADPLVSAITKARRIALYGAGREGLAIKGFAMRLFHLGLAAHMVADMTTPPVGRGDLLIVTSGQGSLPTGEVLMDIAKTAGAVTAIVTAMPQGPTSRKADLMAVIPAQTMASDQGSDASLLPMGSLFEFAEAIFFELVILKLRDHLGETAASMRARHTNLE